MAALNDMQVSPGVYGAPGGARRKNPPGGRSSGSGYFRTKGLCRRASLETVQVSPGGYSAPGGARCKNPPGGCTHVHHNSPCRMPSPMLVSPLDPEPLQIGLMGCHDNLPVVRTDFACHSDSSP